MFSQINLLDLSSARAAWRVLEPYHAMIYFAPEAREAYAAAGLKGFWMGYFASRVAPLVLFQRPWSQRHSLTLDATRRSEKLGIH